MPTFEYQATDSTGKIVTGVIDARDEHGVVTRLREQNVYPIAIQLGGESRAGGTETRPAGAQTGRFTGIGSDGIDLKQIAARIAEIGGIGGKEVAQFTSQLSTLVKSGLTLDRSLAIMVDLTENERLKTVVKSVQKGVHGGSSFADALAKHPRVFNRLYVSMVRAGEAGGILEMVLARLTDFLESVQKLKENVSSALVYPILLTFVGGSAVTVLLTFVIPKFAKLFEGLGRTLPLPTRLLMGFSDAVTGYWWVAVLVIGGIVYAARRYLATAEGRRNWDARKLRLALFGPLIRKIEVARFARTLGTLARSGVPILNAMNIVTETATNTVVADEIRKVSKRVKEGGGIAAPLREAGIFPPMAVHMITVGEETGQLEDMLIRIADTYDFEVESSIRRLVSLIEPVLILVMGIVVGFIVISMLLAIFSINEMPM